MMTESEMVKARNKVIHTLVEALDSHHDELQGKPSAIVLNALAVLLVELAMEYSNGSINVFDDLRKAITDLENYHKSKMM